MLNYRMEFLQDLLNPQSSPPTHTQSACPQLEEHAGWWWWWGGQISKTCTPVQNTEGSKQKKGKLGEILFLPAPPPTLQEGFLPAVKLHAISG